MDKNVFRYLSLITQFGIYMLVPIFLCSFAGMFLDKKLGTSFFMVILFFVGALAGFRNIYVLAQKLTGDKSKGSHDEKSMEHMALQILTASAEMAVRSITVSSSTIPALMFCAANCALTEITVRGVFISWETSV